METVSEKVIENQILYYLVDILKIFAWKNNRIGVFDPRKKTFRKSGKYNIKGVPDICGIYNGKPLYIEVKKPGGYPSKEQKEFITRANNEGAICFIARSLDEVIEKLKQQGE